jgi:DNA-binding PadR family transcriptional regulator
MIWRQSTAREAVLNVMSDGEWWYGLDMMRAAKVRAGMLYRVLMGLEHDQAIEVKWAELEPGREYRRRMYKVADATKPPDREARGFYVT